MNATILFMDIKICFVATCCEMLVEMCYWSISSIAAFCLHHSIFVIISVNG